jgi:hypothetical protein
MVKVEEGWADLESELLTGVNFTNILRAAFSYQSFLRSFFMLTNWICNFLAKGFWRKAALKMLVKLTPGCWVAK